MFNLQKMKMKIKVLLELSWKKELCVIFLLCWAENKQKKEYEV